MMPLSTGTLHSQPAHAISFKGLLREDRDEGSLGALSLDKCAHVHSFRLLRQVSNPGNMFRKVLVQLAVFQRKQTNTPQVSRTLRSMSYLEDMSWQTSFSHRHSGGRF